MKVTGLLVSLALAINVSARSSWVPGQVTIKEDFTVPGDNPLYFCQDPKDDILEIESVDLDPNPPEAGKTLTIKAKGNFKEDVEEGAKIHLEVKYGLITLIKQEADLCETIDNVDMSCPLKKGDMTLTKDVDLPSQIPPGNYAVLADVFTKDGDKITCLQAKVSFHREIKLGKRKFSLEGAGVNILGNNILRKRNEL